MASVKYFAASVTADKFKIKIAFMRDDAEHTITYVYQKDKVMMIYLDDREKNDDIQFRFHDNNSRMLPYMLLLGNKDVMLERKGDELVGYYMNQMTTIERDYARAACLSLDSKMIDASFPEGWTKQIRTALRTAGKLEEDGGFPFGGPEEGANQDPCVWFDECGTGLLIELTTDAALKGLYLP